MRDGEILLSHGSLTSATNRFYYAAFYAARACLALKAVDSARHSGVIALFQQHFVKTRAIDPTIGKALFRAFEKRQKTDYGDFATLTLEEVHAVRDATTAFVEHCAKLIEQIVGG